MNKIAEIDKYTEITSDEINDAVNRIKNALN
jgi:hypothetical protein